MDCWWNSHSCSHVYWIRTFWRIRIKNYSSSTGVQLCNFFRGYFVVLYVALVYSTFALLGLLACMMICMLLDLGPFFYKKKMIEQVKKKNHSWIVLLLRYE